VKNVRLVHVIALLLCGAAIAFDTLGAPRAAFATLALVIGMLTWSIETIRVFVLRMKP
jgi:hypothetical protein